jgi:hypothetical protein
MNGENGDCHGAHILVEDPAESRKSSAHFINIANNAKRRRGIAVEHADKELYAVSGADKKQENAFIVVDIS